MLGGRGYEGCTTEKERERGSKRSRQAKELLMGFLNSRGNSV